MNRLAANSRLAGTVLAVGCAMFVGCGVTRSTDTNRTATEQLLISDAIDRAVQTIDTRSLAGQSVFLDDTRVSDAVDRNYLVSTLRQHLLASGCSLKSDRDKADFVVELRAGAIGTDRNDLLFGVPSMNVPQIFPLQPVPAAIPEVPIAKRRDQRGIAKIAVFAYHRESGLPVWQSGVSHEESSANDVWILGAGPFQRGTIYQGTEFAGKTLRTDEQDQRELIAPPGSNVNLAAARVFATPQQLTKTDAKPPQTTDAGVVVAAHETPVELAAKPAEAAPAATPAPTPPATTRAAAAVAEAVNPVVQKHLKGATTASPDRPVLSATVQHSELNRSVKTVNPQSLLSRPVDPVPLPQPRFNSPR